MGRQGDLLTPLDPNPILAPEVREAVIPMVAALLLEAAAGPAHGIAREAGALEVDDDQDRG